MPTRKEVNVLTGEETLVELTPAEINALAADAAALIERNSSDNKAQRAVDDIDRLRFEIDFGAENRLRALESKMLLSRVDYRSFLKQTHRDAL